MVVATGWLGEVEAAAVAMSKSGTMDLHRACDSLIPPDPF
jgi:hypothetical protein